MATETKAQRDGWHGPDYYGETLNVCPVNIGPTQLVERLRAGFPIRVELEPGDMTRYEFVIFLLQGQLERTAGYDGRETPLVAHVPVNNHVRNFEFKAIALDRGSGPFDFEMYPNEHTRVVLAAFYNCLAKARGEG